MKKSWVLVLMAVVGFSAVAHADDVLLAYIDTNNCVQAQKEVSLLNSKTVQINAVCSEPGSYQASNGRYYVYRLYTTLSVEGALTSGMVLQLGNITTNNCTAAQNEIRLLNSPRAQVDAECSEPGSYPSTNGNVYTYRLYTTVTIN